jgi:hypothetical protein
MAIWYLYGVCDYIFCICTYLVYVYDAADPSEYDCVGRLLREKRPGSNFAGKHWEEIILFGWYLYFSIKQTQKCI